MRLAETDLAGLQARAPEWNELAARASNPFMTAAWLTCWTRAFSDGDARVLVLEDEDRLIAGGCFLGGRTGALAAAANVHSGDWDVVAVDDDARRRLWAEIAARGPTRITAGPLPESGDSVAAARRSLADAGYRVVEQRLPASPCMALPRSLDELLRGRSRNLRSQIGRRRRALDREGTVEFRMTSSLDYERDLERVFAVEASGWKGRSKTAMAATPATDKLYREFAERAAREGWLRLYLLEVDGETIAVDYGCALGGCGYLLKTGFREDYGHLAPGLVLRSEVLRASIEEGLDRYDFLGGPDPYKTRWTDQLRGRITLHAFRGFRAAPSLAWWSVLRPTLKGVRTRVSRSPAGRNG
jgi:CelD/BcsL family acetyltransferase involved in cellulose biosynthesis